MVINTVTKLNLEIKEEGEGVNMCQAIDEMMEDSRLLGVEQGIEVLVNVMKELNVSPDFTREKLIEQMGLSEVEASRYVK